MGVIHRLDESLEEPASTSGEGVTLTPKACNFAPDAPA
jgi:hypothetical protein